MSYRDLRNFTEMMRVLGYPRLISLSNFRHPNFTLVAEILIWLVKRYDIDANVPTEYTTEQDRINLVRYVAEFMVKTANIRLNTKKLYQADGHAVKELAKMTMLLYNAQMKSTSNLQSSENGSVVSFDITDKIGDLKTAKQLSSQLTISGASLFDLLGREIELREIRNLKVASQFDTSEIEVALKELVESTRREIAETKDQILNIKDTEQNLDARIERRRNELDRNQKRLHTLRKVRPAFMEEYEKLEDELKELYGSYLQKFRYLAYLEHLYEDAAKVERERFERKQAATKKHLEQLRIDEANNIDTTNEIAEPVFNTNIRDTLVINESQKNSVEKPKQEIQKSARINATQRRIYGSMSGRRVLGRANGSVATSDSDSDLLIDNLDDDDDDEFLNSMIDGTRAEEFNVKNNDEKRSMSKLDHTDDEF